MSYLLLIHPREKDNYLHNSFFAVSNKCNKYKKHNIEEAKHAKYTKNK